MINMEDKVFLILIMEWLQELKKTYIKLYRENLLKAIELLVGDVDLRENIDNIFAILEEEYNLVPSLGKKQRISRKRERALKRTFK